MSFPNGSAAGSDKIVPQIFRDLNSKSNGSAGLNFLKSHWRWQMRLQMNKPHWRWQNDRTIKTFLFWRKAYRPHKDRRRVETDCHRQHAETYHV